MAALRQCPVCGAALASDAPFGHCPRCLFNLGLAAGGNEPDSPAEPAGTDATPGIGSRMRYFGDYELLEQIGRGGMGVVFKARQISLNRVVAVKLLLSGEWAGPDFEQRFRLEAEAAAGLDHPNIVAIHEVGIHEGLQYFSMDYVAGQTLAERAQDNPLPPELAADYLKTIAGAIHYAHQRGILHRDLKPSNILIDPLDQPRITDFGLAKRLTSNSEFGIRNSELTITGQVLGSPSYVSPEQARGRTHELTTASDIYSLGAILYDLLTGRPPFRGETPVETLRKVIDEEPVRPRALNPAIDRDLETICLKCLEKAPARRYGSAIALADDLERWRRGEPILARRASAFERVVKWARRQPVLTAAVVLLHLVLVAGVGGILWEWRQAVVARQAEAAERQRAVRAEAAALARLHEAKLNYVRANRLTGRPGQRFDSLAELAQAAAHTNRLDLRNEAIACLVLPDVRPLKQWARTPRWDSFRFDASFRRFATNDASGQLTIRDAETDAMLAEFPVRGASPVASFAVVSPDERFVATMDQAGQARVWTWPGQNLQLLDLPFRAALLAFTPDSRALVVKHPDGSLHFLNTTNGADERSFPSPKELPWLLFNSSGDKYLTLSKGQVIIRRSADGEHLNTITAPEGVTAGLGYTVWHPDGRRIAASWVNNVGLWDLETGHQVAVFEGHEGPVAGLVFTGTGEYLASGSWDHTTRLWHTETHREVLSLPESGNYLSINASDRRLSFQTWDHTQVKLYELADLTALQRFTLPPQTRALVHFTAQAAFSPDGELVLAPDKDGIYVFHAPRSAPVALVPVPDTYSVCFARDGSALFTGGVSGAQRWPIAWSSDRSEVHLGPPKVLEPTRGFPVLCVDLSQDGQWLVVQAIVAPAKKVVLAVQTEPSAAVVRLATSVQLRNLPNVSPDGRWVTTIPRSGDLLQVWHVSSGGLVTNLPTLGAIQCAFSADSRRLACTQKDSTTVWDTADWSLCRRVAYPSDHSRPRLAFSPDGQILAIYVSDREVRLVRLETGEEFATLPVGRLVTTMSFSPSGDRLAVADESGYLQLWNLRRVREQLTSLHLDWDLPPYPPEKPALASRALRVIVHTNAPAQAEAAAGE